MKCFTDRTRLELPLVTALAGPISQPIDILDVHFTIHDLQVVSEVLVQWDYAITPAWESWSRSRNYIQILTLRVRSNSRERVLSQ